MIIEFKTLRIQNFLSFGDSELTLNEDGYTIVTGVNKNPDDLAKSNGSGKSSMWDALCWCLTGATIRGSKDVVNIHGTDGALVELNFTVDGNEYTVTRTKDHSKLKSNLKIIINGEDKSGKGIRDSEKLLAEYLPDLTNQLIGSVIILGQGLPQRFTNNSPSGRKEVLEKLSKSDFMIEDLKNRIASRKTELSQLLRKAEDNVLALNTKTTVMNNNKLSYERELTNLKTEADINSMIADAEKICTENNSVLTNFESQLEAVNSEFETLNTTYTNLLTEKNTKKTAVSEKWNPVINELQGKITELSALNRALSSEIARLENIKDVCPTCGQKLPDVHKVDTTDKRNEYANRETELQSIKKQLTDTNGLFNGEINAVESEFAQKVNEIANRKTTLQSSITSLKSSITATKNTLNFANQNLSKLQFEKENLANKRTEINCSIANINAELVEIDNQLLYNNSEIANINARLDVVNKMTTIITRDFRGYLLSNVINFINAKAKEYSQIVFETDKIDFTLDGNDIQISYDGKEYTCLSGGEQQKVNLIVQFAIRDMLCKYLGFSSNILVLDEIFDGLDSDGCQRVLNLISTNLCDVDSIYIISHHTDIPIPYDREIIVEKGADKISRIR